MIKKEELQEEIEKLKKNEERQEIFHDSITLSELDEIITKIDKDENKLQ